MSKIAFSFRRKLINGKNNETSLESVRFVVMIIDRIGVIAVEPAVKYPFVLKSIQTRRKRQYKALALTLSPCLYVKPRITTIRAIGLFWSHNNPYPVCFKTLHQSEAWYTAIHLKMGLTCTWMKSDSFLYEMVSTKTHSIRRRLKVIDHVQYINFRIWLRGFRNKLLYSVSFSLYPSIFWKLRDKRNFKKLQFWPESLGSMLGYWYIERGLLRNHLFRQNTKRKPVRTSC